MDEANERAKRKALVVWLCVLLGILILGCVGGVVGVVWMARRAQEFTNEVVAAGGFQTDTQAARRIADAFIADVNAQRLDAAWQATSAAYREQTTRAAFDRVAKGARDRLGAFVSTDSTTFSANLQAGQRSTVKLDVVATFEKGAATMAIGLSEDAGAPSGWTVTSWKIEPSK